MARGQLTEKKVTIEKTFKFVFPTLTSQQEYVLELPIHLPMQQTTEEYVHRIVGAFGLPPYIYDDLLSALKVFVNEETIRFYDNLAAADRVESQKDNFNWDNLVKSWEKAFKTETVEYADPTGTTDEELFSTVYHKLIHSSALDRILQTEQMYGATAQVAAAKRMQDLSQLADRQDNEMAATVKDLHTKVTEQDINNLAGKHFEDRTLEEGKLNSELETLHENQRKEYRAWLMTVLEQMAVCASPLSSPTSGNIPDNASFHLSPHSKPWPELEESFTIHLGSQMKQMHNVRILSANVLDFCRINVQSEGTCIDVEPQHLETALGLYSCDLSGIVLLSDVGPVGGFTGLARDFVDVCQETTEFHFPTMDYQMQELRLQIKEAVTWRTEKTQQCQDTQARRLGTTKHLQVGDIYITKHSNLSQVHVVFHMLINDSVKSNDMNSRHPVILGLRNVLKTAAAYDVTNLTIPLLLTHEMTEDMTVAWCAKRAELVFKCVKGFMIEAAGASGAELHNLKFLVPPGISPEVFATLATMLPSIFRVSNPLVLKASSTSSSTPQTPKNTKKSHN